MEYVNIGERFNMFLSVKFVESSESFGDLVIWFASTSMGQTVASCCLRIMVPLFTNSTRNLVAYSHLLWLVGCCIAKVVQLPGNWVFGRAWLEEAAWLFGVGWFYPFLIISIPKLGLQMSIKGIVLMCFSSLVAHSSAPQPCWIKTTYFFLHVGCSPCMAPGFVKAKRAVALGLGLNIGITHIRWKRHQGADALPPIAMNFGTLFIYWFYCSAFYQQVHKQYCSSNIYIYDPMILCGLVVTI